MDIEVAPIEEATAPLAIGLAPELKVKEFTPEELPPTLEKNPEVGPPCTDPYLSLKLKKSLVFCHQDFFGAALIKDGLSEPPNGVPSGLRQPFACAAAILSISVKFSWPCWLYLY